MFSRFARNTLDTLKYIRMLKERDIAVLFEDEKINILTMDDELLLVVLSSRCTTRSRKYIC
ncbi:recombinase family protein [Cytobacillus solani]